MPVFAAFVAADAAVRTRPEHDRLRVAPAGRGAAAIRLAARGRALDDVVALLGDGRRGPGGGRAPGMLARRIIPCLDVAGGRVVKGVHFDSLRDAGDPVEQAARYDADGADELVFLDISASHEARQTTLEMVGRVAEIDLHPVHGGRRHPRRGRCRRGAPGRRGQGLGQHRRGARPLAGLPAGRELRHPVRRGGGGRQAASEGGCGDGQRRPGGDAARGDRLDPAARGAGRRRDPAHLDGPRRHRQSGYDLPLLSRCRRGGVAFR